MCHLSGQVTAPPHRSCRKRPACTSRPRSRLGARSGRCGCRARVTALHCVPPAGASARPPVATAGQGQRGKDAQQGQVVVQVPLAAADAVAAEYAYRGAADRDRERNEGHGLRRQLRAAHHPNQKPGLGVHVLHDGGQPADQHPAGDAFAPSKHAARHFLVGEAVGVASRCQQPICYQRFSLSGIGERTKRCVLMHSRRECVLVRLAGIEPTTLGFGGQYSIH